ncbi:MAG: riboflavin synthase [Burkholderiaceae bacterium]|nr:MAG: riboflavin synthase [Burkholderiaceae bacterium]
MFTGIITAVGRIAAVSERGSGAAWGKQLAVDTPPGYLDDVAVGDSIALNGACMTVTAVDAAAARFSLDISAESLARTAGLDGAGPVNLEKALRAGDRLGGHVVSGHVDGVGRVTRFEAVGESWALDVLAPTALGKYLAVKGSVAINGVSLTVNAVADLPEGCRISVNLIPHTVESTTLRTLAAGAAVNLEIDLFARYLERMLPPAAVPGAKV